MTLYKLCNTLFAKSLTKPCISIGKIKTAEAEELYSQALTIDENHPTALHLLGVIRHQQNRNWESEKLILRALAISPDDLLMRSNLGAMPR